MTLSPEDRAREWERVRSEYGTACLNSGGEPRSRAAWEAVEESMARLNAFVLSLLQDAERVRELLADVSHATGIEYDDDSEEWWVPAEPGPRAFPSLRDALIAFAALTTPTTGGTTDGE